MKDEKDVVAVYIFIMIVLSHLLNIWEICVDKILLKGKNSL